MLNTSFYCRVPCHNYYGHGLVHYHIVGNFPGRNFCKFRGFVKVFSTKFGGRASFGGTSEQSTKVFSANIYFPPICERFILQKFPVIQYLITSGRQWTGSLCSAVSCKTQAKHCSPITSYRWEIQEASINGKVTAVLLPLAHTVTLWNPLPQDPLGHYLYISMWWLCNAWNSS